MHNLGIIGVGLNVYRASNQGLFPPNLGNLVAAGYVDPLALSCPSRRNSPSAYFYIGSGTPGDVAPNQIVVYESSLNHNGKGINVLLADGRTVWVTDSDAIKLLDTIRRTGKATWSGGNNRVHPRALNQPPDEPARIKSGDGRVHDQTCRLCLVKHPVEWRHLHLPDTPTYIGMYSRKPQLLNFPIKAVWPTAYLLNKKWGRSLAVPVTFMRPQKATPETAAAPGPVS